MLGLDDGDTLFTLGEVLGLTEGLGEGETLGLTLDTSLDTLGEVLTLGLDNDGLRDISNNGEELGLIDELPLELGEGLGINERLSSTIPANGILVLGLTNGLDDDNSEDGILKLPETKSLLKLVPNEIGMTGVEDIEVSVGNTGLNETTSLEVFIASAID